MQIETWIELALYALSGFAAGGLMAWLITHGILSRRLRSARQALEAQHQKFLDASNALTAATTRLEEIDGLKATLSDREAEIRDLHQQAAEYQRRIAELETILEKERAAAAEKSAMIEEVKSRMTDSFQAMASRALSENNQSFMDLAGTTLSGYLESAKQELKTREKAVNEVVQPIADKLEKYDQEVRSMERVREKAYGELSQQVVSLAQTQSELQRETGKLVNALRMPHVRGRWGEITLRRVVEISGMQNRCDFFEQVSSQTGGGVLRPDMVIQLPGDRRVVVDSKVPITAYLDALEVESREESEDMLSRHARHVQTHVQKLSQKSYWTQFAPTPEFVVLFMPGENFFSAALTKMPNLIEDAAEKGVILATPTTLISLLKAVAYGWKQETAAENARAVSELGNELYNRFHSMLNHMNKLGKDLDRSVGTFNQTVGSMEKRVMPAARRLQEMGVTLNDGKPLPELSPIEDKPRHVDAEEEDE
ncbi:MAG TPA: DNA recombination protein RmuC [Desulfosalsimonadaceae bacterium]|nr:DNA recombination protein RmuC [Desulfosalsimonadaceae bacterium]